MTNRLGSASQISGFEPEKTRRGSQDVSGGWAGPGSMFRLGAENDAVQYSAVQLEILPTFGTYGYHPPSLVFRHLQFVQLLIPQIPASPRLSFSSLCMNTPRLRDPYPPSRRYFARHTRAQSNNLGRPTPGRSAINTPVPPMDRPIDPDLRMLD